MTPALVIAYIAFLVAGLLLGRWAYALWLGYEAHAPNCPRKNDVIEEARRVQLDIDQLIRGAR